MERVEESEHHRDIYSHLDREADKTWVHHVADLDRGDEVHSETYDRPVAVLKRVESLTAMFSEHDFDPSLFWLPERVLTPRCPYQASPQSYLNALGRSWSLMAGPDRLEWAEFGASDARHGGIDFWFRNVTVGAAALVTIDVSVGAIRPGVIANISVRASGAVPRSFPMSGMADHTLDLVVRPYNAYAVLVALEIGAGVSYMALQQATYRTL